MTVRPTHACLSVLILLSTAVAPARPAPSAEPLRIASGPVDEASLLDVGIAVLELGVDEDESPEPGSPEIWRANPDIRQSEAVFIPFHLKTTLESTGHWGAVRVLPLATGHVDVLVSGRILKATPRELSLELEFSDATGRSWRRSRHRHQLEREAFPELPEGVPRPEPHQPLYDEIANSLLDAASRIGRDEVARIREMAELRFAAELSPELFGDYLHEGRRQRLVASRLPAVGDPMVERMRRIRERDHAVVDTLNEHYADFYENMEGPYWEWRQFSHQEFLAWRKIRRQARTRSILGGLLILGGVASDAGGLEDAAVLGGAAMMKSGFDKRRQAKIHAEALGELAGSYGSEVTPLWIEVEGRTLELQGTAKAKYEQWRGLLGRIFAEESGLPLDGGEESTDGIDDRNGGVAGDEAFAPRSGS